MVEWISCRVMNRRVIIVALVVTGLLSVFSSLVGESRSHGRVQGNSQEKESFFVFFADFCRDSAFQVMRVKFPLVNVYLGADLDSVITEAIDREDWKYVRIKNFTSNTFEYYFTSFDHKQLPDTDEMVYSIVGVENGIQVNYYFKRETGKWFLVKMEDLST